MRKKIWIIAAALLILAAVWGVAFMKQQKKILHFWDPPNSQLEHYHLA